MIMNELQTIEDPWLGCGAVFSSCTKYRYALWRTWNESKDKVLFICLNPSTADARHNDPTVRRCIGFARRWGFGGMCLCNLFGFRATSPIHLHYAADPVGPDNDRVLADYATKARIIVAAWGNGGTYKGRDLAVREAYPNTYVIDLTSKWNPRHPLYAPYDCKPMLPPWANLRGELQSGGSPDR